MAEDKTEVVVFGKKIGQVANNGTQITPKSELTFLGYILQDCLKVDQQVDKVSNKVRAAAARIWQFPYLPMECKKQLYYA